MATTILAAVKRIGGKAFKRGKKLGKKLHKKMGVKKIRVR